MLSWLRDKTKMNVDELIKAEQKMDKTLYSSGPYWNHKNARAILEIKKKGLSDFRGTTAGIGTSFSDNQILDVRNEFNIKGKIIGKIFSLPLLNIIFNSQINKTKDYLDKFLKNEAIIYKNDQNILNLLNKFKFDNTTNYGCVLSFKHNNKDHSCYYLELADRINKLSQFFNFNNISSFFVIFGGFGGNIHFLITNFPNIKKIIYLDVVPNIYVGTEYLRSFYKEKVKDYNELKKLDKISFSNNDELEILCIPPWLIEKVDVEIDHFHNSSSFVEMPNKVVENYLKFIRKFKTKEISLTTYDYYVENTFNPENLNNFFDNKLKMSRMNSAIEDQNKKFLYFTSN